MAQGGAALKAMPALKLAVLGSTTVDHLLPSIEWAAFRRGFLAQCYLGPYNQYRQELLEPASGLYAFKPDVILLMIHATEAGLALPLNAPAEQVAEAVAKRVEDWTRLWKAAKERLGAVIIQSTLVVPPLQVFGQLDAQMSASPQRVLHQLNEGLRAAAAGAAVLMDMDALASKIGKMEWCQPALWFHAKQDIPLAHAPVFGDYAARLLGAIRGLSRKCLVLDLDGTLWGGTIGDDGVEGIQLGQGDGVGESFLSFQRYVRQLKERGILLAVASKNDLANAVLPFDQHPETVLRRNDFSAFVANWEDKVSNLQRIASQLQIGLDSLVFFDDDAAERQRVREALPDVAVPEVPEDPADYPLCLSEAGYFESIAFTKEDQERSLQYRALAEQVRVEESGGSLEEFLNGLGMEMAASPFDRVGLSRIAQLINKSNQFNLTTRRYTEAQVEQMIRDDRWLTFQFRLKDRLVDHGMISVLIAEPVPKFENEGLKITTWLMSCRVVGRHVEREILNILVAQAKSRGYRWIQGVFIQTAKNHLVREHFSRLGFAADPAAAEGPESTGWRLDLGRYSPDPTPIRSHYVDGGKR